ncbi:hypothetical protein [Halobacterium salinarum]|uniref:hypothetical protein n=1 Tax=Halobacterium salinarum TaxID=2242 RepID=UPI0025540C02|nr:hypothetical protein [Halobacterium salinarum]MDL0123109.1 hypothetical protein [Halobacterium salinarum]MDL0131399.1 hypothetical protein [Halobacterium salinarum]
MSNDDELEQLRQQSTSGGGNRIDADATKRDSAVDDLVDALKRVDEGDVSKTLSLWAPDEAAMVDVLMEDDERLQAMLDVFGEELDTDIDANEADRSDLLKLALRYAIADVDPELLKDLREARRERAIAKADEGL